MALRLPPERKPPAPAQIPEEVLAQLPPMARYAPSSRRQRLLIAGLALAAATTLLGSMLVSHADYLRARLRFGPPDVPRCADGQTEGCTGGTMDVTVVPATPPAASASR
jgi:hypothetical protein